MSVEITSVTFVSFVFSAAYLPLPFPASVTEAWMPSMIWLQGLVATGALLSWEAGWLAGLQWKPMDTSQVPNIHLVMLLSNGLKIILIQYCHNHAPSLLSLTNLTIKIDNLTSQRSSLVDKNMLKGQSHSPSW